MKLLGRWDHHAATLWWLDLLLGSLYPLISAVLSPQPQRFARAAAEPDLPIRPALPAALAMMRCRANVTH